MPGSERIKIVYIMEDCPAYGLYKHSGRPEVNWDLKNGNWLGIWGYDWGNQLGEYVLKNDGGFDFEVRQPDLRADRVYEHRFENKTVHRLYPAKFDNRGKFIYSQELVKDLIEGENRNTIVHTGVSGRFTASFLGKLNVAAKVGSFHSEIILPIDNLFTLRKNVMNYRRVFADHLKFKRLVNEFDVLTYQTGYSLERLRKYYSGKLEKVTMGTDFSAFRKMDKANCRKELGLQEDAKIFISVGRINNIKGQTGVVKELLKLGDKYNYIYIILGHGLKQDEEQLHELSAPLKAKSRILLPGYIRGERLVKYLNASDVFLMPSSSEAGPVASMEAAACELPVITMDTGSVADFLKEHGFGFVTGRNDFESFGQAIKMFLDGRKIQAADRKLSEERFGWNNIGKKFIDVYRTSIGAI